MYLFTVSIVYIFFIKLQYMLENLTIIFYFLLNIKLAFKIFFKNDILYIGLYSHYIYKVSFPDLSYFLIY